MEYDISNRSYPEYHLLAIMLLIWETLDGERPLALGFGHFKAIFDFAEQNSQA